MAELRTVTKTVEIDPPAHHSENPPVPGACKVWWLIDTVWAHKGWLMPEIKPTEFRRGK